MFNQTFEPTCS